MNLDGRRLDSGDCHRMNEGTLGARIRSLRETKKHTLRAFAASVGMSPSFLSEIESGKRYPSAELLNRIASELGVSPSGLRKLDRRREISGLKKLLESDPAWGVAFVLIAKTASAGKLTPSGLIRSLGGKLAEE
jgi:transcriptional regulator with XRE-family HTH domain